MKKKPDPCIGKRTAEEYDRLLYGGIDVDRALKISKSTVEAWRGGNAPSSAYLQWLHQLGADALYILTGERSKGVSV